MLVHGLSWVFCLYEGILGFFRACALATKHTHKGGGVRRAATGSTSGISGAVGPEDARGRGSVREAGQGKDKTDLIIIYRMKHVATRRPIPPSPPKGFLRSAQSIALPGQCGDISYCEGCVLCVFGVCKGRGHHTRAEVTLAPPSMSARRSASSSARTLLSSSSWIGYSSVTKRIAQTPVSLFLSCGKEIF